MKKLKMGMFLLFLVIAGLMLVPTASAVTAYSNPTIWKSGSTIYFGGSGGISSGTANFLSIGCTLDDYYTGSAVNKDYTGATGRYVGTITASPNPKSYTCTAADAGHPFKNTCGVYAITPTANAVVTNPTVVYC